ncbi:MAG: hypothetical protein H6713_32305 [Myxococcales bacterium]|nr:hypothetical protein [Myxococcales bacterium]
MSAPAWSRRVALWDEALAAVRSYFRGAGAREVSTPVRVAAPAIEPYIEPITAPPGGYLATSPELAMKRLLCRGSGSIFQISHVFRRAELGRHHAEEFHLLEWYRVGEARYDAVQRDVEAVVAAVFALAGRAPPRRWVRRDFFDLFEETTGVTLTGSEDVAGLIAGLGAGAAARWLPLAARWRERGGGPADPELARLLAWTELFTTWSDEHLPGWLDRQRAQGAGGVHVDAFPEVLAALAERERADGRAIARRFESHVLGVELANGYRELRDAQEQRRRFERVNALRQWHGQPALPLANDFLHDLESPGLPPCAGVALGLDRLLMLATGASSLAEISLALGSPVPAG